MNERIKELAEQAGITFDPLGAAYTYGSLPDFLERFAELVRQDEREKCAKDCADATEEAKRNERYIKEIEQPTPKQSGTFLVTKRTFKCTGCSGTFESALEAQYHSCKDNK